MNSKLKTQNTHRAVCPQTTVIVDSSPTAVFANPVARLSCSRGPRPRSAGLRANKWQGFHFPTVPTVQAIGSEVALVKRGSWATVVAHAIVKIRVEARILTGWCHQTVPTISTVGPPLAQVMLSVVSSIITLSILGEKANIHDVRARS
jgi:hypothetical protein